MENNQFPQGQDEQITAPQPEAQPQPAPQAEPELSRQPNFGPQPPMGPQPMDAPQPVQTQVFGCPPAPPQANVQPSAPQPPVYANAPVPPQPPYAPQPGVPGAFPPPPPAPKQSRGMAISVSFGLTASTFFTLVFVPIVYCIVDAKRSKINGRASYKKLKNRFAEVQVNQGQAAVSAEDNASRSEKAENKAQTSKEPPNGVKTE